jgi:uncharacterized RDD family membrane protein YckC
VEYEDVLTIETPEGVDLMLTLAGVGSRFVSAIVDYLIQAGLLIALALLLFGGVAIGDGDAGSGVVIAVYSLASFLVFVGYDVTFEVLNSGQTPGKRMNGLRVVRTGGQPIGFVTSAVRNVLRLIDWLPLGYAVGMLAILVTKRNQRLGDLAAGTLVVRARKPAPSPVVAVTPSDAQPVPDVAGWDTTAITADELAAVRSFLDRRDTLELGVRNQIAATLADGLRPKVAGVPGEYSGERFLEALAAAKSARV